MNTDIWAGTDSWPWRRQFSCCLCRDLNPRPSDLKSVTLPLSHPCSQISLSLREKVDILWYSLLSKRFILICWARHKWSKPCAWTRSSILKFPVLLIWNVKTCSCLDDLKKLYFESSDQQNWGKVGNVNCFSLANVQHSKRNHLDRKVLFFWMFVVEETATGLWLLLMPCGVVPHSSCCLCSKWVWIYKNNTARLSYSQTGRLKKLKQMCVSRVRRVFKKLGHVGEKLRWPGKYGKEDIFGEGLAKFGNFITVKKKYARERKRKGGQMIRQ